MNKTNNLRVSVVIPVYNEADHIAACLQALAQQTLRPYEVIVVDNNSTDGTAVLAQRFDFVTVVNEPRQGVANARNTGFNAAKGDIIGRIDADTLVSAEWIAQITAIMTTRPELDAVSGAISYYDVPHQALSGQLDLFFRQRIANGMGEEVFLYGANMAIRRDAWRKVRSLTCAQAGMHEDFDLAIHLSELGSQVAFNPNLIAAVSLRRFNATAREFWQYVWLNPKTYAQHGLKSQRHMYPACLLVILFFLPLKLAHQGFDATKPNNLSWRSIWNGGFLARPNPATHVD